MGIFFVVFEVICIMVSWLFAKRIVKERWLGDKRMLWAEDETMDINEMRQIAECIFNDEKANVKNCSVTRKFEDEIITEVIVETERKKFSYKGKNDETIINKAWTEDWAILYFSLKTWAVIHVFTFLIITVMLLIF